MEVHTLQSVDSPLFELFESDLCGRRDLVEIQPIRVILLLIRRSRELLLLVVQSGSPLRIDTTGILSNHLGGATNPNPVAMSVVDSTRDRR